MLVTEAIKNRTAKFNKISEKELHMGHVFRKQTAVQQLFGAVLKILQTL